MIPMSTQPRAISALFTVFAIVATCSLVAAQDSSALTNEDVIKLVKAGLPSAVIVAKISSSVTDFDTSVDALLALSAESIPPDVMTAMAEAGKQAPAPPPSPIAPAYPAASAQIGNATIRQSASVTANVRTNFVGTRCEEPGIYLDDGDTLKLIEPTTAGQSQSGGFMKLSHRNRVGIRGLRARVRIENQQPRFLFCFEESQSGLSYTTGGAVNPSEFLLVTMRLDQKQGQRYYVTAKVSKLTGTTRSGAASQYLHDLWYDRIKPGVFEAKPAEDLPTGEYAFYFAGNQQGAMIAFAGAGGGGAKLFPFGVD